MDGHSLVLADLADVLEELPEHLPDRDLELDPDAGKPELEQAIEAHLLATAELVGTYER
jgi:phosphatidylethanolamine-binding protein (PEBP) family uncharacterized protein